MLRCLIFLLFLVVCSTSQSILAGEPVGSCKIVVRDKATDRPVPMVELRTTSQLRFVTDNAGVVAFDAPELMNQETWLSVHAQGYEVPADGFGMRGVRMMPKPDTTLTIKVVRTIIAERLGRLTGNGKLAESQKLGEYLDWKENSITGCDSVQLAIHRGRAIWNWGDTNVVRYPLGNFHMTGATTDLNPFVSIEPPIRTAFEFMLKEDGSPKPMAPLPGKGPTWLSGYASIRDENGIEQLVACYRKIKPPLDSYEIGLCEWNEDKEQFEATSVLWKESEGGSAPSLLPEGHPVRWTDEKNERWLLFGNPFPTLRCRDELSAWRDPSQWESLDVPKELIGVSGNEKVKPHTGSIAWNAYRQRWVTVFMQYFGQPSAFGEIWYAESESPMGAWGKAIKILSHDNYTFYNPRVHGEFSPKDSPILYFEGTYTQTFANKPFPTPRYDYNQILYRLKLDDPRLTAAQDKMDRF